MSHPLTIGPTFLPNAPIQDVERLWLEGACAYEYFDDPILEDDHWDALGRHLRARWSELSPYFLHAVQLPYPPQEPEEGENPLKTASGINWDKGLPQIVRQGLQKDWQRRMALWRARIRDIEEGDLHLPLAARTLVARLAHTEIQA